MEQNVNDLPLDVKVKNALVQSMKDKNQMRTETLRGISAAFLVASKVVTKDKNGNIIPTVVDHLAIVTKLASQRVEAIGMYAQGTDEKSKQLVIDETEQLAIIKEFLPRGLSNDETEKVVKDYISENGLTKISDKGKLMGYINANYKGQVDNRLVNEIASKILIER